MTRVTSHGSHWVRAHRPPAVPCHPLRDLTPTCPPLVAPPPHSGALPCSAEVAQARPGLNHPPAAWAQTPALRGLPGRPGMPHLPLTCTASASSPASYPKAAPPSSRCLPQPPHAVHLLPPSTPSSCPRPHTWGAAHSRPTHAAPPPPPP